MTINKEQPVSDAEIERKARAICELKGYDPDFPTGENTVQWQSFRDLARSTFVPHPLEQQQAVSGDVVERVARAMFDAREVRRMSNPHIAPARWEDHREYYIENAVAALTASGVERMREALVDHNDRLRSCCQVADRDGRDTNWKALRGQIHYTLAEHHEITNAARTALQGGE